MIHSIGKSGTGIGKSGTGIGKSGTGSHRLWLAAAMCLGLSASLAHPALAGDEPSVRVFHQADEVVMVTVGQGQDMLIGAAALSERADGYYAIELYPAGDSTAGFGSASMLVKGSGSGSSGQSTCSSDASLLVKGSGSGNSGQSTCSSDASLLVKGSGSGSSGQSTCSSDASLLVKGSGSGSSGQSTCSSDASLLVKGSGSGNSGQSTCSSDASLLVKGSGSGSSGQSTCSPDASLLVKGSGSGSSGNAACPPTATLLVKGSGSGDATEACVQGAWGVAELLFDNGGANLIVHRLGSSGLEEFLVAYLPASGSAGGSGLQ